MILLVSMTSCTIGVKEKVRVIYTSYSSLPEESQGAMRIATNQKIPITIVGEKDINTSLDLGGYFVISKNDLLYFIGLAKNANKK